MAPYELGGDILKKRLAAAGGDAVAPHPIKLLVDFLHGAEVTEPWLGKLHAGVEIFVHRAVAIENIQRDGELRDDAATVVGLHQIQHELLQIAVHPREGEAP